MTGVERFLRAYRTVDSAKPADRVSAIRSLTDAEVVGALAMASRGSDAYLANVLATEAMNRNRRRLASLSAVAFGAMTTCLAATGFLAWLALHELGAAVAPALAVTGLLLVLGGLVGAWVYLSVRSRAT